MRYSKEMVSSQSVEMDDYKIEDKESISGRTIVDGTKMLPTVLVPDCHQTDK